MHRLRLLVVATITIYAMLNLVGYSQLPLGTKDAGLPSVPFYITWVLHYHQPLYNENGSIVELLSRSDRPEWLDNVWIDRASIYKGLPATVATQLPGDGCIQVDITGSLIEQLNDLEESGWFNNLYSGWKSEWASALEEHGVSGYPKLTILGSTYYHSILPLVERVDERILREQIRMHREAILENFGVSVDKGFFLVEEAYTPEIIPVLVSEGFEWTIVDSEHLFRATQGYYSQHSPEPNGYDVRNSDPGDWDWGVSPTLLFRPHVVEYNGSEIVVFVRYRDVSQWEMNGIDVNTLLNQIMHFQQYNTDPERPFIMVIVHDGDNGFPLHNGGQDYYINYILEFMETISSNPEYSFIKPIGLTQYLRLVYDPRNDTDNQFSRVYVEPGSWETMDTWGDPFFTQWCYPSLSSIDQYKWSLIVEATNTYWTTYHMVLENGLYENYSMVLDSVWRDILLSTTSCYFYWDGNEWWDRKVPVIIDRATTTLESILSSINGVDRVEPTIMYVWRDPYNPVNVVDIYVHVYDYSGVAGVWANVYVDGVLVYSQNLTPTGYRDLYRLSIAWLKKGVVEVYVYSMDYLGNIGVEAISPFYSIGASYVMDGLLDSNAVLVYNSSSNNYVKHLWIGVDGDILYVACDRVGVGDLFIFISSNPWINNSEAPWAKEGVVAWYEYYLGVELDNGWSGWFRYYDRLVGTEWTGSAVGEIVEGYINLSKAYGFTPNKIYVAVACYTTEDGGYLVETLVDLDHDGDIDPSEYIELDTEHPPTPIPEPTHYIPLMILIVVVIASTILWRKGVIVSLSNSR